MSAELLVNAVFSPHAPNGPGPMTEEGIPVEKLLADPEFSDPNPYGQIYIEMMRTLFKSPSTDDVDPSGPDSGQIEDENSA